MLVLSFAATAPSLAAKAPPKPTAIVSLGDSFISGEAGRWRGNSLSLVGDRNGTDRAWTGSGYDPTKIYGDSGACHRSDSAEIQVPEIAVDRRVNLACSGAVTENIFRSTSGGVGQNGEPAQADSLQRVAKRNRVRAIVLSISGNDLGFADIITGCALAYIARVAGPCNAKQQDSVDALMPDARTRTIKAIAEIRAVMKNAGYKRKRYQLIVQSYPSPVPRASEARYRQAGVRRVSNGCPFFDADLNWARDSLVKQIGAMLRGVARERRVRYLDLTDALQGREPCGKDSGLVTAKQAPNGRTSEWARFLTGNLVQGEVQETLHPNYYGQRALAECFRLAYEAASGNGRCLNRTGKGPEAMRYIRTR